MQVLHPLVTEKNEFPSACFKLEKLKINLESVSIGSEDCKVLASSTNSSLLAGEPL
jgi:hypothetical protein